MIDNYDLFAQYDAEQEEKLNRLPRCCRCKEPIQQEQAVRHKGKWYCEDCEEELWEVIREDYLRYVENVG